MPLFRSPKDIAFVKRINRELIERVVGEKVTYYPISKQFSQTNFYGESKEKIVDPPVEIYALIEWQDQEVTTTEFGQDRIYLLQVYFLNELLQQIELEPVEGDMIDYDGVKYEITKITEPTLIFGKAGQRIGKSVSCRSVREGNFKISVSGTIDHAKRTSPDESSGNKTLYDNVIFPYSGSV